MPKRTYDPSGMNITPQNIGKYALQKYDEFCTKAQHNECISKRVSLALIVFNAAIGVTIYKSCNDERLMEIVSFFVFLLDIVYIFYSYNNYYKESQNYSELAHYLRRNYIEYNNKRGDFSGEDAYDKFLDVILHIDDMKFKNDTELRNGRNDFLVQHLTKGKTNGRQSGKEESDK